MICNFTKVTPQKQISDVTVYMPCQTHITHISASFTTGRGKISKSTINHTINHINFNH